MVLGFLVLLFNYSFLIDFLGGNHVTLHFPAAADADPRDFGKGLSGNKKGYWRYRIGDYRLLCEILDRELVIIAITVDHRSVIYKK